MNGGDDPYLIPGANVFRNLLNIANPVEFAERQAEFITVRLGQLCEQGICGVFNSAHLCQIHLLLFQDLFDWAGKFRTMGLHDESRLPFMRPENIALSLNRIFDDLTREKRFKGLGINDWTDRAVHLWREISIVQPFREGNAVTTQEFIRQLGLENGLALQWERISSDELHDALEQQFLHQHSQQIRRIMLIALDPSPQKILAHGNEKDTSKERAFELN